MRGPTAYQFAHHRTIDDERCLIWGNGIGEVLIPVASPEYVEALGDRAWQGNALADEGESDMLAVYFRTQAKRANMFGRLFNDTPVETDTLATLTGEVTGTGYAAVTWAVSDAGFPTLALDTGDFKVTSSTQTFTAGGAWTVATNLVVATVASGTAGLHVAWAALSASRTLATSDTLDVSVAIKLA
jgi:hypothetical protein